MLAFFLANYLLPFVSYKLFATHALFNSYEPTIGFLLLLLKTNFYKN
jgi:hypothetical protein